MDTRLIWYTQFNICKKEHNSNYTLHTALFLLLLKFYFPMKKMLVTLHAVSDSHTIQPGYVNHPIFQ